MLWLALAPVVAIALAPVASAHAFRVAADPPPGALLAIGPARVSATFNEQLNPAFTAVTVVGPDGNLWSTGEPQARGAVASVGVLPLGPAGTYTVNYRVTSADGHVVSGSWSFQLTVPGDGRPAAAAAADDRPWWPLAAGAASMVVTVAAVGWWFLRRR